MKLEPLSHTGPTPNRDAYYKERWAVEYKHPIRTFFTNIAFYNLICFGPIAFVFGLIKVFQLFG